jgi:hypothetical protein
MFALTVHGSIPNPCMEVNTTLSLQGNLHDLPRKELDFLSKFNGEGIIIAFEHIKKYESELHLFNIIRGDVVCTLFPFIF